MDSYRESADPDRDVRDYLQDHVRDVHRWQHRAVVGALCLVAVVGADIAASIGANIEIRADILALSENAEATVARERERAQAQDSRDRVTAAQDRRLCVRACDTETFVSTECTWHGGGVRGCNCTCRGPRTDWGSGLDVLAVRESR